MAKKPKRVPGVQSAPGKKAVRSEKFPAPRTPSWKFSSVDRDGERDGHFYWPSDHKTVGEIVERLHQFDAMTWEEIEGRRHHAISISSLSLKAQRRLAEIGQDDIDEVFSFSFSGRERLVGIRDANVVRILWWDPNHQVCPSPKKHT